MCRLLSYITSRKILFPSDANTLPGALSEMSACVFPVFLQHVCTGSRHAAVLMHHQYQGCFYCGQMRSICPWKEDAKNKCIYFLAPLFHEPAPLVLPTVMGNSWWCIRTGGRLCCRKAGKHQQTASFAKGSVMVLHRKETNYFSQDVICRTTDSTSSRHSAAQ